MMLKFIAWLGGAVFVAALALCAWWYVIWLGRDLPKAGWRPFALDAARLTLFACHHSLFAREWVKGRLAWLPASMIPSFYVWIASLLLIGVIGFWSPIGGTVYHVTGAPAVVHAAVQLAGVWLISRAVSGLDALELAGIRQASQPSRAAASPQTQTLQIGGPYRWVRHPLYLGWMLALFGAAHMTGDRLAFAGLTSLYLIVAVPWEERSLRRSFGADYRRYAQQVRWRILPYLY
jgi:protein-S-isoprenylcysteine O-methyltransferase Ste14